MTAAMARTPLLTPLPDDSPPAWRTEVRGTFVREQLRCTPADAVWCPLHGKCSCDAPGLPCWLHGGGTTHGEDAGPPAEVTP